MRHLLCLFAVLVSAVAMARADNLQTNQILIVQVKQSVGEDAINAFPDPSPILGLLETSADFRRLAVKFTNTWERSLANMVTIAPDRASRLILLHALLYLPPDEYLKCLNHLLDLYQGGKLSSDEFIHIFWLSPREENNWFLSFNYTNTEVLEFLKRVRAVFKDHGDIVSTADFIISGKAKARDEVLRREDPDGLLWRRKIPLLVK